jgi:sugar lactone lactonase YvrE
MIKLMTFILFLSFIGCSSRAKKEKSQAPVIQTPNIVFTLTEGIAHPESALYSQEHGAIFVSNVASGNPVETKRLGNISKYSADGKLIASPWIKGLKAPKGMAIVGNFLYVSDVNQVAKIDIKKGKIVQTLNVKNSKFLNDVTADAKGNVYISDMMTDTIHIWDKKGLRVWMKSPSLRSPNGLFTDGTEHILLASWGNPIDPKTFATQELGAISALSLKSDADKFTEEKTIRGNFDGISADAAGNLWISDWMNGDIYQLKKTGEGHKVYNLGQGAADLSFAKELNLLLVPQMNESKVFALKVD